MTTETTTTSTITNCKPVMKALKDALEEVNKGKQFVGIHFRKLNGSYRMSSGKVAKLTDTHCTIKEYPPRNETHQYTTVPLQNVQRLRINGRTTSVVAGDFLMSFNSNNA